MSTSTLPPRTTPDGAPAETDGPVAPEPSKPVLSLSATALVAGALAAMTSAVIGSHLGTAGTLTGAALGSVIGASSTALYVFGLERTWHALRALPPLRAKLAAGVVLAAVAAFVLAIGAITGMEKVTGTSLTGQPGTTIEQARSANVGRAAAPKADPEPAVPSEQAAPTASEVTPTPAETAPATPTPAEPTPSGEPTTPAPTQAPTTPAETSSSISSSTPATTEPTGPAPTTGATH